MPTTDAAGHVDWAGHTRARRATARSRAFTLAESLIASVVLAVAVAAVATAMAASSQQADALDVDARAVSLARQLMEDVLARPFDAPTSGDQPGCSSGNNDRATYDDIDDFAGYSDTVAAADADPGNRSSTAPLAATLQSYSRTVSIAYRNTPAGASVAVGAPMMLVSVTVTPTAGTGSVVLHRLVTQATIRR